MMENIKKAGKLNNGHGCTNCAYYMPHYILTEEGRFIKIAEGHCINRNYTLAQSAKIIKRNLPCGFWDERQKLIEERVEHIVVRLRAMANSIEEISAVLKDYNG